MSVVLVGPDCSAAGYDKTPGNPGVESVDLLDLYTVNSDGARRQTATDKPHEPGAPEASHPTLATARSRLCLTCSACEASITSRDESTFDLLDHVRLKVSRDAPAGRTAVAITAITIALSAVFLRPTWPALKAIGRGVSAVLQAMRKMRIASEVRILRRVDAAVQDSRRVDEPDLCWQWRRDPTLASGDLRATQAKTSAVGQIFFDSALRWKWDAHPKFPTRVRDGWRIELRGGLSAVTNARTSATTRA